MKKLIILGGLAVSAALPATATAERVHNVVSIHADQYFCCTDEVYGSVESAKAKCEHDRTIRLFHRPAEGAKRGNNGFEAVESTTTNRRGEYLFQGVAQMKLAASDFPSGEYFARATRAERGDDVCPRDDSRVIEIQNFTP